MMPDQTIWIPAALAGLALLAGWYAAEKAAVRLLPAAERRWLGWRWLAYPLALLGAALALVGGLAFGLWSPDDAGLAAPVWANLLPWLPGFVGGMALWIGLLWGGLWQRLAPSAGPREGVAPPIARALRDEALLMALRGALVPLAGPYWGAWLASALRLVVGRCYPAARRPLTDVERATWWLQRALDLASTVVVIMTGSVWVSAVTRLLLLGVAAVACAWAWRRSASRASTTQA